MTVHINICVLYFSDLSNNKISSLSNSSFANMSQLTTLWAWNIHYTDTFPLTAVDCECVSIIIWLVLSWFTASWVITPCAVSLLLCLKDCPLFDCCEFLSNHVSLVPSLLPYCLTEIHVFVIVKAGCFNWNINISFWPPLNPHVFSSLLSIFCRSLHGNNISELHQEIFRDAASLSHLWVTPVLVLYIHTCI